MTSLHDSCLLGDPRRQRHYAKKYNCKVQDYRSRSASPAGCAKTTDKVGPAIPVHATSHCVPRTLAAILISPMAMDAASSGATSWLSRSDAAPDLTRLHTRFICSMPKGLADVLQGKLVP